MKKLLMVMALLLLAGCAQPPEQPTPQPSTLTVMTHDSFEISEEVLAAFESEYGIEITFLKAGDTGTAVNKAALSVGAPLADVFYGVDNTFLSRALDEGVFEVYDSPLLADIPAEFKLDPEKLIITDRLGELPQVKANDEESLFNKLYAWRVMLFFAVEDKQKQYGGLIASSLSRDGNHLAVNLFKEKGQHVDRYELIFDQKLLLI